MTYLIKNPWMMIFLNHQILNDNIQKNLKLDQNDFQINL